MTTPPWRVSAACKVAVPKAELDAQVKAAKEASPRKGYPKCAGAEAEADKTVRDRLSESWMVQLGSVHLCGADCGIGTNLKTQNL